MRHVTRGRYRLFAIAGAFFLFLSAPAAADFDDGLSAFLDNDYRRAREIWLDLAALGDAQSQFGLGMIFEGGRGVPPDAEKAAQYYLKAADQGMSEAQLSLGSLFEHGRCAARDPERAAALYRSAAQQGNAQAQYNLAVLYLGGEGIAPNRERGIAWLRLSARQRYGRALQRLEMLDVAVDGSVDILTDEPEPMAPSSEGETEAQAMAPENTDGAEAAAATPAADPGDAEQLQILIEDNQFGVPLAALEEVAPESSAPESATPRETDFSVLLATFDREDAAAGWEVLKTRYPALLEKLRPKYSAVKLGDGDTILWRLEATAVTSENAAVALCEALRREGEYCFPLHSGEAPKN